MSTDVYLHHSVDESEPAGTNGVPQVVIPDPSGNPAETDTLTFGFIDFERQKQEAERQHEKELQNLKLETDKHIESLLSEKLKKFNISRDVASELLYDIDRQIEEERTRLTAAEEAPASVAAPVDAVVERQQSLQLSNLLHRLKKGSGAAAEDVGTCTHLRITRATNDSPS